MSAPTLSPTEEALGNDFFVQPAGVLEDVFGFIYAQALGALRDEVRSRQGTALEYMVVERIAFMYAYLRQREAEPESDLTDRTRREMNKDFLDISMALRKLWATDDSKNVEEAVLRKVNKAVFDGLKALPEAQAQEIQYALAGSFEAAGL